MEKDVGVLLNSRRLQVGSGFFFKFPHETKQTRPKKGHHGLLGWASATPLASQTLALPPGEAPRPLLRQGVVVGVLLWSIKQHLSARRHTIQTVSQTISQRDVTDGWGERRSGSVASTKTLRGTHMMDGVFSHLPPPGWLGKTSSRKKYT